MPGEEFNYSPVSRMSTVRILLSVAVQNGWNVAQIDVPTAFLNSKLEEDVYIQTPKGVRSKTTTMKLNRALYGLRGAPKAWNNKFNDVMKSLGLRRSKHDFCLYCKKDLYLVVFVDDAIITGDDRQIEQLLVDLHRELKIKILDSTATFLGMQIQQREDGLKISQPKMVSKLLEEFKMNLCRQAETPMEVNFSLEEAEVNSKVPYRRLICSLMYLAVTTRPDISYSVSYLSRYLDCPTTQAWKAAQRILRYLSGTREAGLFFKKKPPSLVGWCDADWGGDRRTRRSVSGFVAFHCGNPISWFSKKQNCVALSTMEAEYISAGAAAQELLSVKGVVSEFNNPGSAESASCKVILLIDNLSALSMMKTYENSKRSKHIDIRYHFIKDICASKEITVNYIRTDENVADIFTKPLGKQKFNKFKDVLIGED